MNTLMRVSGGVDVSALQMLLMAVQAKKGITQLQGFEPRIGIRNVAELFKNQSRS